MGHPALAPLVEPGADLSAQERTRYARHILLPGIGILGQRRLKAARVLVVGAGGLGSPALAYLAAAGVGTLGIVDDDVVDVTNLQRQVVHGSADVGRPKTTSAAERILETNPFVDVVEHRLRLDATNALEIISGYDLVLDGADNFPTRYLVGDACALVGIPHVWASVYRFDAQASVWFAGHGPCYRCVFPEPPPPGAVPSCATGGVLGAICAAVGSVQASEAIKLIVGQGDPLIGRLLVHDALRQTWDSIPVRRNPSCPLCGDAPTITELIDYEAFCGLTTASTVGGQGDSTLEPEPPVVEVSAPELASILEQRTRGEVDFTLVDVRDEGERAIVSIPGAVAVHLDRFRSGEALATLPAGLPVVVHCKSGARSAEAVRLLAAAGRADTRSLAGGVLAWVDEVDGDLAVY